MIRSDPDQDISSNEGDNSVSVNTKTSYLQSIGRESGKKTPRRVAFEAGTVSGKTKQIARTGAVSTGRASSTSTSAYYRERLDAYNERLQKYTEWEREKLLPALAERSYHMPGNGCCEDWLQYFSNTHPLFGICCHHRKHPVRWHMRIVNLLGSIVFGLMVTNLIWLFLVFDENHDAERTVISITVGGFNSTAWTNLEGENSTLLNNTILTGVQQTFEVTEGMVLLWTVGGMTHALFDNTIWYLTACACCLPGRSLEALAGFRRYGTIFIVFLMISIAAVSSLLVVLRASLADQQESKNIKDMRSSGFSDDQIDLLTGYDGKESFQFLASYGVELLLALLLWYPMVGTVLFSGILSCGKLPVLGGRPYEISREKMQIARKIKQERKRQLRRGPVSTATTVTGTLSEYQSSSASRLSIDDALDMCFEVYDARKYKRAYKNPEEPGLEILEPTKCYLYVPKDGDDLYLESCLADEYGIERILEEKSLPSYPYSQFQKKRVIL